MEVPFHWAMVAYYAYADITAIKGALQAHSFRSSDPEDIRTNRMIYGSFSYITIWNLLIQQLYFVMCCREHLLSKGKKPTETLRRTRLALFHYILFPTTFAVAMLYWYKYWTSPMLVFGDILARIYPFWMDHVMHTFIVPIALVAMYLDCATREGPPLIDGGGKFKGWLAYNAFLTFYMSVVIVARLIRGLWPYPFLDPINDGDPLLFFLQLYAVGGCGYYVGQHLSHHIWRFLPDGEKKRT